MKKILVTGGAGYIGSHTIVELINNNCEVLAVDNLSNSSRKSIDAVYKITNKKVPLFECDMRDKRGLHRILKSNQIDCIIHFAALKAVGDSVKNPEKYYDNNVNGAKILIQAALDNDVNNFIFSSSATVYGREAKIPYKEEMQLGTPTSPYGETKVMIETMLSDKVKTNKNFSAVSLRYFNPIGAHESGLIGEDPNGIPDNLMPYISQVAIGKLQYLNVFGDDYPTEDGTCKRDYIHITDLANGHIAAINWLLKNNHLIDLEVFNLGTGEATSVFEVIKTFEDVTKRKIPFKISSKRAGDLPQFWADSSKALEVLNWKPKYDIKKMIFDLWKWQSLNPNGYE